MASNTISLNQNNNMWEQMISLAPPVLESEQSFSSQTTQVLPEHESCVIFTPKSSFANAYSCSFEFEGKTYKNAAACFLAQQYTDQQQIMDLFTLVDSEEEAIALAQFIPITKERKLTWEINKDDVLTRVQRAKFEQNPELKKQLLSTGDAYLVFQDHDFYFGDNFNGTGKNALGICLMRLRGEYGGKGEVAPVAVYRNTTQTLQTRCSNITSELYPDIMGVIFSTCISICDLRTITALPCINKNWNQFTLNFVKENLRYICPELTIMDAKTQQRECADEPKIDNFKIFKAVKKIAPHVEGNAGVTLLTMIEGDTLNKLIKIANQAGIQIFTPWDVTTATLGDIPIGKTRTILITNSIFIGSRKKDYNSIKALAEEHGCQVPEGLDYLALCIFSQKIFQKCLYGKNPLTFGCSTTRIGYCPLMVGAADPGSVCFVDDDAVMERYGVGGKWKF